jgi:hypothetical protein
LPVKATGISASHVLAKIAGVLLLVPAQAEIPFCNRWIPACAGMTES